MSPYCLFTQAKPKCCDYIGCRQSMGGANTTSYALVSWDNLFSVAVLLCLHVDRYAGRLPLLAASDSRPGNDQQTAVTWGQKSLLTRPCLTLLTQAISSFYHASLSGFSPHPLATHALTWAHINEDTFISGSTWRFVLLWLSTVIRWVHICLTLC